MPARILKFHKTSPFQKPENTQLCRVVNTDEYHLSVICSLSPPAIRLLFYLMAKVEADGSVQAPIQQLRKNLNHPVSTLSKAFKELHAKNLIAKRNFGVYWLSNRIIMPLHLTN